MVTRIQREEWYEAENLQGETQQAPQEKHTEKQSWFLTTFQFQLLGNPGGPTTSSNKSHSFSR